MDLLTSVSSFMRFSAVVAVFSINAGDNTQNILLLQSMSTNQIEFKLLIHRQYNTKL